MHCCIKSKTVYNKESMEEEKWVIDSEDNNKYSRGLHSSLLRLNRSLENCYVSEAHGVATLKTMVTTSGMHAISLALKVAVGSLKDCNVIHGNELYCDSNSTLNGYSKAFPINILDVEGILSLFQQLNGQNNVLFIESCSNPSGHIFDFRIIPELRRLSKELIVIVDNTWLTHCVFNPFEFDVDMVVLSLTKYYSAGTIIAGACLVRDAHKELYNSLYSMMRWVHISGYDCSAINRNMETINDRLSNSSSLTLELVNAITASPEHSKLLHVCHPVLPLHPSNALAHVFFKTNKEGVQVFPSCFTFQVSSETLSMNKLRKLLKNNTYIDFITSFGCPMSRLDPYPQRNQANQTIRIRFAVGYRDSLTRVMEGLAKIFE